MTKHRQFPMEEIRDAIEQIQIVLDHAQPVLERNNDLYSSLKDIHAAGEEILNKLPKSTQSS